MIDINAIYIMILTSKKPVKKILGYYDQKLPFSEIHAAMTYLNQVKFNYDYEMQRSILGENIKFLYKHLT